MASIADLNVRLGLIYKDFDKGMDQVKRRMRKDGRELSQLGDQLTVAISLPIAAAGAAAVKSAGDIESLQLALESQTGSAEAARKELELLRIEALKPGLGFEQAVRGSVALQAVGFSADKARKIISEFGNGLAVAGKGAQELDGVVLALSQIQSKGYVSAEEINQIAERLPQIRTLMLAAFGTASSEAIKDLGLSSEQFIEGITTQLEKLPRASGGIKNSLENFFDAIKQGAAKFGFAISKAIDLPVQLEQLTAGLGAVAEGFTTLNPETQKFVVYAGLAVVAAGPLAKVLGAISTAGAQFVGVIQGAGGVLKGVTSTVFGLTDSVNRLKLAFGIVGVVVAVGAAAYLLAQRFDAAAYAQEQYASAAKSVTEETSKEIGALDKNFEVLKNVNSTHSDRKAAIDALLAQYPSYLKGINLEIQSVDQLTGIQKKLVEQIQRGVAERKKAEAINSIYEKRAEILLRVQQLKDGADATTAEATLINTGDMVRAGGIAEAVIKKLQQQSEDLRVSADATGKQFDAAFGLVGAAARRASPASQVLGELKPATDAASAGAKGFAGNMSATGKATKEAKTELDLYLENLHKVESTQNKLREAAASMGLAPLASLPQAGTGPVQSKAPPPLPPLSEFATGLSEAITPAQAALDGLNSGLFTFNEIFSAVSENVASNGTLMEQAVFGAANAMSQAAASGEASFGKLGAAALSAAAQVVRAKIMESVAGYIADSITKFGIFGLAIGAAGGALVGALFTKALGAIKVPGFAAGTNNAPGGLALVGERGPELVGLPRGSTVTPNHKLNSLAGGGGNMNVSGEFVIKGPDLVLVLEKAHQQAKRIRGY